ncbi:aminopeptidase N [Nocardioides daphniae]|uniref:Aminopeptidase N n=1 Tax=Nocardioides daphniae TaxID=402297 RepID=A0A4V1CWH9_9ACTN|nr:aminopeptidase N [Nocardioides daphniae]QCC77327.1 aminopeptidase N [Nocardioides daphniae]
MSSPYQSLQRTEATERRTLLDVQHYDVSLDLTGDTTFASTTVIDVSSRGGSTFLDLKPTAVEAVRLDGRDLDLDLLDRGRFPLDLPEGTHRLEVVATMPFRNDGEGLHLHVDPADGRRYVYGMSFMDAAPTIFACFDQPDLKAPYTFHVRAPQDWTVIGNAPGEQVEPGVWELATTPPLSTYFVTLVAGPYHLIHDEHDGIPLGLSARQSLAGALEADAKELLTVTKACFDEFHRLFGIRYPFGNYHQAFVPEFNAGAMENPGCVTFRDPLVFSSRVTRGVRIQRATTVAHEMAHQWFGNIVTPQWWDDLWLNESFAEYMGNRVTADVTEFSDAWTHNAYLRRQWGLNADQRPSTHPVAGNGAVDATAALQDFDGISYAKGSSILKQLNARMGDDVFFAGAVDHFDRHRYGNATMHDLFDSWTRAGAEGLEEFTGAWLRTAGPDTLAWDRSAGALLRTPPADHPADRTHAFRVAVARDDAWEVTPVTVSDDTTPFAPEADAVLLDPYEDTWAAATLDDASVEALLTALPTSDDAALRAGAWNSVRTTFALGRLHPDRVVALAERTLPTETNEDALASVMPWILRTVVGLSPAPQEATRALHAAASRRVETAPAGTTLQLAGFQSAAATCTDPERLRAWLGGDVPAGIELDLDLRWALHVRLAVLGATTKEELDAALADEPTARSRVEHARAVASLPQAWAKEWAWERFTGAADVPNYELEAAGLGMWRSGQEELTEPYVERFFEALPALPEVHSGWVLGTAIRSFFPFTSCTRATVDRAHALAGEELDPTVRRNLVDHTFDLECRLATRSLVEGSA